MSVFRDITSTTGKKFRCSPCTARNSMRWCGRRTRKNSKTSNEKKLKKKNITTSSPSTMKPKKSNKMHTKMYPSSHLSIITCSWTTNNSTKISTLALSPSAIPSKINTSLTPLNKAPGEITKELSRNKREWNNAKAPTKTTYETKLKKGRKSPVEIANYP